MGRWYEGAEEAAFKPASNGYVAQLPGPTLFGRPRSYVVNKAQKAEITAALRRQRRMMLAVMLSLAPVGAAFGLIAGMLHSEGRALSLLWIGVGTALLLLFTVVASVLANVYAMRPLRPLLATLPLTDERISLDEQVGRVARSISGKVLVAGLISGPLVVIANVLMVLRSIYQGYFEITVLWNAIACLGGAMLTAYFIWLSIMRRRRARGQPG
jgi:hypothetical protein